MDPEACGCIPSGDGQLYQPVTCGSCGGSMRINCGYCGATGLIWYPCPHQKSLGMQAALSAAPQDGSSYGRKKPSKGGGSSKGHASILSA